MSLVALIPARSGSKRLPGKNIKLLDGLPLIAWTIRAARASGCFNDILVSTDDAEIADVARAWGASVPWLRPTELATDTARSVDVVLHALDRYEQEHGTVGGMMLLQPTSPFRSSSTIQEAACRFFDLGADPPVVSVSQAENHPAWTFSIEDSRMQPFCGWGSLQLRAQDLPLAYTLNGAIYVFAPARLRAKQSIFSEDMHALIMLDHKESLDIDTMEDWDAAERWALSLNHP